MTAAVEKRTGRLWGRFASDESGATSIEYGLIVSLIFLAIVTAVRGFTDTTTEMYDHISDTLVSN